MGFIEELLKIWTDEVQAMENEAGNRFGLQFHPEVDHSEYGKKMFENFIEVCSKAKIK